MEGGHTLEEADERAEVENLEKEYHNLGEKISNSLGEVHHLDLIHSLRVL